MSFWPDTYAEHATGVRSFLRRRLRSTELAEDLTQETFARALQAGHRLRDPGRIRAYLYQTAHRLLLNHRRRPHLVRTESELGDRDLEQLGGAAAASAADAVTERDLRETVERALATLPPDQRRAFRWAVLEQRPYDEIAEHTGWSRSKVKISVFRGRRAVMRAVEEAGLAPSARGDSR